tara:strand:+ start:254 stop:865 length:612 start_codon:yes stop_codon:yes gene_type:complete
MFNLFGIPIYLKNIKISEKDINTLINLEYERLNINNGYISKNKQILKEKQNSNVKDCIFNNVNYFLYEYLKIKKNISFKLLNSWCMKHVKNDWSLSHHHDNSLISGILYLKTYKNSGDLILHRNNLLNVFSSSINIEFEETNINNCNKFYITPKKGDLILFPSYLEHSVTRNLNQKERYCCAFNFYPSGSFGNKKSFNELNLV